MSFPRYPRYKDSGVKWLGEVPEHWEVTQLKRVVDPLRPITYGIVQAGPHVPDGIAYVRPTDMYDEAGVLNPDDLLRTSHQIAQDYRRSTISVGDLVCSIGPSFGKVMVTPASLNGANLTQGTARVAVSSRSDARYIFWVLRSDASIAQWVSAIGGATFRALNLGPLAATGVPVPPLSEQRLIASMLDCETAKIDALIAEQQRLIELLKEKRQAVISHAVTRGLDPDAGMKPSGVEWLGDVPAHWQISRLKHVSPAVTVGIVVNPSTYAADEGLPFIYGGDIREDHIDWANARRITAESSRANAKTQLCEGDLLTVRVGAPGVTAVVPAACTGGNCASVMLIRKGNFNSGWLSLLMNTRVVRFQVEVVQYGAAQEQFNISHAINFLLPVPPRTEQDEIVARVRSETFTLDALVSNAERAITLLQERRIALISASVTGKIDVRGIATAEAA